MGRDADHDGTTMHNPPAAGQAGDQASPDTGTGGGGENLASQSEGDRERRVDIDGDGRTRNASDTRPTDDGGQGAPVQR